MTNRYLEKVAEMVGGHDLTDEQLAAYHKARSKNNANLKVGLATAAGVPFAGPIGMAGGFYLANKYQRNKALKSIGVKD